MLNCLNQAIKDIVQDTRNHINHITSQVSELLKVIEDYPQSATELMVKLKLKSRNNFRINYLIPALEFGLIKMTLPNKPTSRNQRYFKA